MYSALSYRIKILAVLISFSAGTTEAFSQFNDSLTYYTGVTSTGTYNKTNLNETILLNNAIKLGVKKNDVAMNANHKWLYGLQGQRIVNNDFSAIWDLNIYKTFPHFNYWGLFIYNKIYSLRINNQLQSGLGIAYNIIDREHSQLNISDGVIYDHSDVHLSDSTRDIYSTFRNSLRIQYKFNFHGLSFRAAFFLQNSLEYKRDYITRTEASLNYRIKKWLSLTIQGQNYKMTRTRKETTFITYGLTFEKYF